MGWHEAPDSQADGWKAPPEVRPEPSVQEMLDQIERLDFVYDAMEKTWIRIQENLRHPWRFSK